MKLLDVSLRLQSFEQIFTLLILFHIDIMKIIIFYIVIVTGYGDLTYNTRRNLLGAISVGGKITYHLFSVNTNCVNVKESIKLMRKSKWHSQYSNEESKFNILLI